MSINLTIKKTGAAAGEFSVDVDPSSTVAELKEKIAPSVELPAENIRLVCAGRVWDNVATLASYNVAAGSTVHCLNNPPRAAPVPAAQTLAVANPMQQMMASSGFASDPNSGDPFDQMHAQVQQQMMQNPELIQQMMNSPMMQQMMSNPEMMRNMMRMNPRMNQLMEQRPEIARMLEDPEVIQQSMRMMQNPELMREMVRNQDRAMGNLDVMPGGHQALMRAHEEFLDPIHAAMSGGNGAGSAGVNQPAYDNTAAAPNNEALPNPWGAPASAPSTGTAPVVAPPPMPAIAPTPAAAPAPAATNPMQQMMQQMMGNPAMMQQMMGNPMMGNPAMPQTVNAPPSPFGTPAPNPMQGTSAPNPMQQMMQQMMNNPAMMQQAMAMTQQMMNPQGQAQQGAPAPNPLQAMMQQMNAGQTNAGQQSTGEAPAVPDSVLKMRFASQLVHLANMGFSDESMCLRALAQHNGRLDSAIDVLLTGSVG